ncbi:hypothetical protein MPLSOD_40414 [Mesorhizobium sp. SOD10]|nr:hypothetical protein MPLSOD_40414 [Mesorhizobium sp. SOD10]
MASEARGRSGASLAARAGERGVPPFPSLISQWWETHVLIRHRNTRSQPCVAGDTSITVAITNLHRRTQDKPCLSWNPRHDQRGAGRL